MSSAVKRIRDDDTISCSFVDKIPRSESIDVTEQLNELRSDLDTMRTSLRSLELQVTELKTGFASFTQDVLARLPQPQTPLPPPPKQPSLKASDNLLASLKAADRAYVTKSGPVTYAQALEISELMSQFKYEEALELLLKAPSQNDKVIISLKAKCYFHMNKLPEARNLFEQIGSKLDVAHCYGREGKFEEAYKILAELSPSPKSIWIKAYCNCAEGKYAEALQLLNERTDPLTCHCLLKLGKFKEAQAFLLKFYLSLIDAPSFSGLGDYFLYTNQYNKARLEYAHIGRLNPRNSVSKRGEGDCELKLNHITEARKLFEEVYKMNPYDADAQRGIGDCIFEENDIPQARIFYSKALVLIPANMEANLGLAKCFLKEGKIAEAKKCFDNLVKLTPENPWLKVQIENCYKNICHNFNEASI